MPLLQRGELLQRERVDLAEHGQGPLGRPQPLLLLLADVRHRLGRASSPSATVAARRDGTGLVGAVLGDQRVGVEPELVERALLELLDAHPLLGAGHLVAVHGVDQLVVLRAEVAQPRADREQLLLAAAAGLLDARPLVRGLRRPTPRAARGRRPRPRPTASATRPSRSSRSRRAIARARASRSASAAAAARRPGRPAPGPAPRRCAAPSRASISACARGAGRLREPLPLGGVGLLVGAVLGGGEPALELGQAGEVPVAGLLGGGDRRGDRSASPLADRASEP